MFPATYETNLLVHFVSVSLTQSAYQHYSWQSLTLEPGTKADIRQHAGKDIIFRAFSLGSYGKYIMINSITHHQLLSAACIHLYLKQAYSTEELFISNTESMFKNLTGHKILR